MHDIPHFSVLLRDLDFSLIGRQPYRIRGWLEVITFKALDEMKNKSQEETIEYINTLIGIFEGHILKITSYNEQYEVLIYKTTKS